MYLYMNGIFILICVLHVIHSGLEGDQMVGEMTPSCTSGVQKVVWLT